MTLQMKIFTVYSRLYGACLGRALQGIRRSPWTVFLPMGLFAALMLSSSLLGGLGLVGGMLLALVLDALISSYLYFTSEIVAQAKVSLDELKKSFGAYFWSVLNLFFVIWLVEWLLGTALVRSPDATVITAIVQFAAFVLLNATPE